MATRAGLPPHSRNACSVIVLCRHGATDANVAGAFLSTNDPPLNALGREQSERARVALRDASPHVAFTSPMRRCVQTLEIVAPQIARTVCEELREIAFGTWEGRTIDWLERHEPEAVARRRRDPVSFRPPGGESFADVARRLLAFAGVARAAAARGVIVVGHRGTLGVLERLLRGVPLDARDVVPLEPGEVRVIEERR